MIDYRLTTMPGEAQATGGGGGGGMAADGTPAYAQPGSPFAHLTPDQYRAFYAKYSELYAAAMAAYGPNLVSGALAAAASAQATQDAARAVGVRIGVDLSAQQQHSFNSNGHSNA
jgi:hypothetical protein